MTTDERDQLEAVARDTAAQVGLEYFDTRPALDIAPVIGKLTLEGMQAYGIMPLTLEGTTLTLGVSELTNPELLEPLKSRLAGYNVVYRYISQVGWDRLLNRFKTAGYARLFEDNNFDGFAAQLDGLEPKFMLEPIAQLAFSLGASDIHLEPDAATARLRFRIDGTLHPIITLPRERYDLLTSDLQMRAGVKWGSDTPQGGRITIPAIDAEGEVVDLNMRLETIPSLHGQDVVIRLFNLSSRYMTLDSLQLSKGQRSVVERAIEHPRGLVLVVGPTGSGKTSTLYAVMNHLNNPEVKIVTLEDPVEYELTGISQVPVHSEDQQLFMEKLRAVLREDPNIIMIGEIRDADTAKTALQAALTGHLVLSTFHAASAAAALTRLMDMIGQNPLLASSMRLVMAQRLVRKLCTKCRKAKPATKAELLEIKTALDGLPAKLMPKLDNLKLYAAEGCDACHNFGYAGRLSLVEQLSISEQIEEMLGRASTAITTQAIEQAARHDGMITLLQDGVLKAIDGLTTLEEVYTAVGE